MAKVSVILTVYNKPQWLKQCIESVLLQTYEDWELIIMEDNSPDPRVKSIVSEYESHRKIQVHYSNVSEEDRYKTARYATLINEAVRNHSTGKYITYLADDDYYLPWRLEVMASDLDLVPGHRIVYGAQLSVDADGNIAGARRTEGMLRNGWDKVDHNSVMHRREVFDAVDGWDDNVGTWGGADSYFWRRVSELDPPAYLYPVGNDMPNEAKRYHTDSVQWKIANKVFFPKKDGKRFIDD